MAWWGKESTIFGRGSKLGNKGTSQYPEAPLGGIPNWKENFQYIKDQEVMDPATGLYYRAVVDHYSTEVFATDLLNEFWVIMISTGSVNPDLQSVTDEGAITTVATTFSGGVSNQHGVIKPYRAYVANVNASSSDQPVVNFVNENNLASPVLWTRISTGTYIITCTINPFSNGRTRIFPNLMPFAEGDEAFVFTEIIDPVTIQVRIQDINGILVDGFLMDIEIRVYN